MTNTKHTPGPWRMELIPSSAYESRRIVAKDDEGDWQTVANGIRHFPDARLIAAAPELLAALTMLMACIPVEKDPGGSLNWQGQVATCTPEALAMARAAIALAKGS